MSAEPLRLDPTALPVRFTASDAAADGQIRSVEICRERVLVRRSVRGMSIRFNLPHQAFRGVSLRFTEGQGCAIALEHTDPGLSIPLAESEDEAEMFVQWEAWSQALSLPLMLGNESGAVAAVAAQSTPRPAPRRRQRNAIRGRRPTIMLRRKAGRVGQMLPIHTVREIIARD